MGFVLVIQNYSSITKPKTKRILPTTTLIRTTTTNAVAATQAELPGLRLQPGLPGALAGEERRGGGHTAEPRGGQVRCPAGGRSWEGWGKSHEVLGLDGFRVGWVSKCF